MTERDPIFPEGAPKPLGPYSPAIRTTEYVFASGTTGTDPETGALVQGGVPGQTQQALANLKRVLEAADSSLHSVVKTTVFMVDLGEFEGMNAVYREVFGDEPPARSTVQVAALPGGAAVEIEAIALRQNPA